MRRIISQRLIKDYGFKFIAVEGDWPDAYRLNKYIKTGDGGSARNVLMRRRGPRRNWMGTTRRDHATASRKVGEL